MRHRCTVRSTTKQPNYWDRSRAACSPTCGAMMREWSSSIKNVTMRPPLLCTPPEDAPFRPSSTSPLTMSMQQSLSSWKVVHSR